MVPQVPSVDICPVVLVGRLDDAVDIVLLETAGLDAGFTVGQSYSPSFGLNVQMGVSGPRVVVGRCLIMLIPIQTARCESSVRPAYSVPSQSDLTQLLYFWILATGS